MVGWDVGEFIGCLGLIITIIIFFFTPPLPHCAVFVMSILAYS